MDKKLLGLTVVFLLLFTAFSASVLLNKQFQRFTRAKEFYTPSSKKSLLLAFPLEVKADGQQKSKITVFVRNSKGVPLENKIVEIKTNLGTITPASATTDKNGKAIFEISSTTTGLANIKAVVDNIEISQKVTIKFSQ